jgi:translation initiation factor 1 (eIF-1/SUI1)
MVKAIISRTQMEATDKIIMLMVKASQKGRGATAIKNMTAKQMRLLRMLRTSMM